MRITLYLYPHRDLDLITVYLTLEKKEFKKLVSDKLTCYACGKFDLSNIFFLREKISAEKFYDLPKRMQIQIYLKKNAKIEKLLTEVQPKKRSVFIKSVLRSYIVGDTCYAYAYLLDLKKIQQLADLWGIQPLSPDELSDDLWGIQPFSPDELPDELSDDSSDDSLIITPILHYLSLSDEVD